MKPEELLAIELVAYYKASSFLIWKDEYPMALINRVAKEQAKFACNFAMQRVFDQCEDLAAEQDIELSNVLYNHSGWTHYSEILKLIDTVPLDEDEDE